MKVALSLGAASGDSSSDNIKVQERRLLMTDVTSPAHLQLKQYLDQVIGRYKGHPSILYWEIDEHLSRFVTKTVMINLSPRGPSLKELSAFYQSISKHIKSIDPVHLVSSGDGALGERQWQKFSRGKKAKDNYSDHIKAFELLYRQSAVDLLSINYFTSQNEGLSLASPIADKEVLKIKDYQKIAKVVQRPLVVSSFTPNPRQNGLGKLDLSKLDKDEIIRKLRLQLEEVLQSGVQVSFFCCIKEVGASADGKNLNWHLDISKHKEYLSVVAEYNDKLKKVYAM